MRRFTLSIGLISVVVMLSVSAASGVGPQGATGPVGADAVELARGGTDNGGSVPVELGKNVVMQTFSVEPGGAIGWHQNPEATVVIVKSGMLHNYVSCTEMEMWEAGKAYVLSSGGPNLTKNEGKDPAEILALFSKVPADQPAGSTSFTAADDAPAGCPTADTAKVTELGRGVSYGTGAFKQDAGMTVAAFLVTIEPGYTSGWHRHPGENLVIQTKGTLVNYTDCKTKEVWTPGNTYLHLNSGHHDAHSNLTKNEGKETAEVVALLFNVPKEHPSPFLPISYEPAPQDCPTKY